MSNTTEVKIKNRLWRHLSKRVNRKNIQRLATNFRHTLARIFCMGNGQPSTEAEREQGDDEKSMSDRVSPHAEDVNAESPDVETDNEDDDSSNSDQDGTTYDADIESEATESPRVDGKDAEATVGSGPDHAGTRVDVLRQLQKQMFMEDTFTAAKPPLPPQRSRAPVHCTRPVQEVNPLAPPQKEVAPPQETEVAQQQTDMEGNEEVEEKAIEDMTEEDIDDIINEILGC